MSLDDEAWSAYLYLRNNPEGMHAERWRHIHGCGRFFNARRNTVNDTIAVTYLIGANFPLNEGGSPS